MDDEPAITAQQRLELIPDRLRITGDVPIEGTEGRRFPLDGLVYFLEVLVRSHGDQAEYDAVENAVAGENEAHDLVPVFFGGHPPANPRAGEDDSQPGEADEGDGE